MRVLIIQNFDNTGLGQVGVALAEVGAEKDLRKPYLGDPLPKDASGHDAIVVLGGGQSALDDDDHPYIPPLLDLMRDFADRDRSVLGICLGSQLLARAYGARNLLGTAKEFGWREIARTHDGMGDPLLSAVQERFRSFQWHDDTFSLPPGAVRLATNEVAENQAFRIGRAVYGIQFHFEADKALVSSWNSAFADYIAENHPDWDARHGREEAAYGVASDGTGLALARAWVATIPAGHRVVACLKSATNLSGTETIAPSMRHCPVTIGRDKAAILGFGIRIMLQKQDKTAGFPGAASNGAAKPASQLPAGPFDVSSAHRESETMTLPDALVTGVLVIYPVLATVAVIAVGLFLSAPIA